MHDREKERNMTFDQNRDHAGVKMKAFLWSAIGDFSLHRNCETHERRQ